MDKELKVRENRIRRMAERQELRLVKSRQRDPKGRLHGTYALVDTDTLDPIFSDPDSRQGYGLTLDEVERFLDYTERPYTGDEDDESAIWDHISDVEDERRAYALQGRRQK